MTDLQDAESKPLAILRVAGGNFLEMYDFMVYAYFAGYIGKAFFPNGSEFASLMASLATFGAGYLMRPFGALVLGAYIDRHGRRKGLLLTLVLMALGTLTLAVTPNYGRIGVAAPLLVLAGRLVQGFSAGVELGGVSVYLSEIATPGKRGFYTSFQSASQQAAVMVAALFGVTLEAELSPLQMQIWGWRVPLAFGCLIVPLLFVLRRSLRETEAFGRRTHHPGLREVARMLLGNWPIVLVGIGLTAMTTTSFYLITAYTPTFGTRVLGLTPMDALIVTLCVGASNLVWLPIGGSLSDRIGRRRVLVGMTVTALLVAYPVMAWLVQAPGFGRLLAAELTLSAIYGIYNGAMVAYLTEIMPEPVRTAGFSVAYSMATALGGFTPGICTWLTHETGNDAMPGLWLSFAALLGLVASLVAARASRRVSESSADPAAAGAVRR